MFENLKRKNLDMDLQYRQPVISNRKTYPKLVLVDNASDKLYFGPAQEILELHIWFALAFVFFVRPGPGWFARIRPEDYLLVKLYPCHFC